MEVNVHSLTCENRSTTHPAITPLLRIYQMKLNLWENYLQPQVYSTITSQQLRQGTSPDAYQQMSKSSGTFTLRNTTQPLKGIQSYHLQQKEKAGNYCA